MVVSPWSVGDVIGSRTDGVAGKRRSRKKDRTFTAAD
jgi:hypothetical protein